MLVPLNTAKRSDLALSIITTKKGYSVLVVSIKNGIGLDSFPSYAIFEEDDDETGFKPITWIEDYPVVEGTDLYQCIHKALLQIGLIQET